MFQSVNKELDHKSQIRGMKADFIIIDEISGIQMTDLRQKQFVFTGTLDSMTRNEAQQLVNKHQGAFSNTITRNTNFLVAGPDVGQTKITKAKSLNVPVITEKQFLEMIDGKIAVVGENTGYLFHEGPVTNDAGTGRVFKQHKCYYYELNIHDYYGMKDEKGKLFLFSKKDLFSAGFRKPTKEEYENFLESFMF